MLNHCKQLGKIHVRFASDHAIPVVYVKDTSKMSRTRLSFLIGVPFCGFVAYKFNGGSGEVNQSEKNEPWLTSVIRKLRQDQLRRSFEEQKKMLEDSHLRMMCHIERKKYPSMPRLPTYEDIFIKRFDTKPFKLLDYDD